MQRVLVVDDEVAILRLVKRILGSAHEVMSASSAGEAASVIASSGPFDVVLCDVMMPDVSGVELFDQVAAVSPDQAARFVFATGGAFTPQTAGAIEASARPQIAKPYSPRALHQAVADMLASQDRLSS